VKRDAHTLKHIDAARIPAPTRRVCIERRWTFFCVDELTLSRWCEWSMVWLVPIAVLVIGAGALARAWRRGDERRLTSEPVSGQWLADARSREEDTW
jgi:paraquat-inducible protein B